MEQSCRPRAAGRSGLPPPEHGHRQKTGGLPTPPLKLPETERLVRARLWAVQHLLREERPYAQGAAGPGVHPDGAKRRCATGPVVKRREEIGLRKGDFMALKTLLQCGV